MSIPFAPPSPAAQWILSGCKAVSEQITPENGIASLSGVETLFYGSLVGGMRPRYRLVNWVRETCIAHFTTIQALFNTVNAITASYYATKLVLEIRKCPLMQSLTHPLLSTLAGRTSLAAFATATLMALSSVIWKRFSPSHGAPRQDGAIEISEGLTRQQQLGRLYQAIKMVLSVALTCFTQDRLTCAVTLATSGYSFAKSMKLKWMHFSRDYPVNIQGGEPLDNIRVTNLQATYSMLALPPGSPEQCSICLDNDANMEQMAFCANHVFHEHCIAQHVLSHNDAFLANSRYLRHRTDHYVNGNFQHSSYSYNCTIPENNLPNCPNCRDIPAQNCLNVVVTDADHGVYNASMVIERPPAANRKNRQPLFENLYAVYNMAQTGLAFLQKYPELTATIFKIQQFMMITDFIGYAFTTYYAYEHIKLKCGAENSIAFKLAACVTVVAVAALSYYAVVQVNAYLKSALILKDLLAQLPIDSDTLKNIEIDWYSPLTQRLVQTMYVNRFLSTLALAFFSPQRKTNLLSAVSQLYGLLGVSKLRFIEFSELIHYDFGAVSTWQWGSAHLKSFKIKSLFLIDPSCTANSVHLQSTLKSIYQCATTLFDKSAWDRYWLITSQGHVETKRVLVYTLNLSKKIFDSCACTLTPNLVSFKATAIDYVGGAIGLRLT